MLIKFAFSLALAFVPMSLGIICRVFAEPISVAFDRLYTNDGIVRLLHPFYREMTPASFANQLRFLGIVLIMFATAILIIVNFIW